MCSNPKTCFNTNPRGARRFGNYIRNIHRYFLNIWKVFSDVPAIAVGCTHASVISVRLKTTEIQMVITYYLILEEVGSTLLCYISRSSGCRNRNPNINIGQIIWLGKKMFLRRCDFIKQIWHALCFIATLDVQQPFSPNPLWLFSVLKLLDWWLHAAHFGSRFLCKIQH